MIAKLRKQTFRTLPELRAAVGEQMAAYNREPFQKRAGSRVTVFAAEGQPLLRPLPAAAYEISDWVYGRRVARNSHITWAKNYYSVPYTHVGEKVDVRITDRVVEVYRDHQRLSSRLRLPETAVNQYVTNDADLPPGPGYQQWDQDRVRAWAARIGANTQEVVDRIFAAVPVAEQGLNPDLAVLRLARRYSHHRLDATCAVALASRVPSPRYAQCARSWNPGKIKPERCPGQQTTSTMPATFAARTTTQETVSEQHRYRNPP